jgi:integrase
VLSDITPWLIEKYKTERKDRGKSNQTVNLELACLKTLFSKAMLWGKATENPVKHVKMLKVNNARVRFLEEEEEARLLPECKEHLQDLVMTALHTGFRRNERPSLRLEDIDFAGGLVSVQAGYAKNGEGRAISMTATLRAVMRRLVKEVEMSDSLYLSSGNQKSRIKSATWRDG